MRGAEVDFIARIAAAWDGRGREAFTPPTEHMVLLKFAGLPPELHQLPWRDLQPEQRRKLVLACRRVFELARVCAWTFGAERLQ